MLQQMTGNNRRHVQLGLQQELEFMSMSYQTHVHCHTAGEGQDLCLLATDKSSQ